MPATNREFVDNREGINLNSYNLFLEEIQAQDSQRAELTRGFIEELERMQDLALEDLEAARSANSQKELEISLLAGEIIENFNRLLRSTRAKVLNHETIDPNRNDDKSLAVAIIDNNGVDSLGEDVDLPYFNIERCTELSKDIQLDNPDAPELVKDLIKQRFPFIGDRLIVESRSIERDLNNPGETSEFIFVSTVLDPRAVDEQAYAEAANTEKPAVFFEFL